MNHVSDCEDPSASFCMTSVLVDLSSRVSIYKRCVGERGGGRGGVRTERKRERVRVQEREREREKERERERER